MSKIGYRPDIDGLRSLAVLGVILCHAFPTLLPGGFSGVDIFLVISGYLISGIIYKENSAKGSFHFRAFYARRVRRLFPSLIVLLLLTLVFGNLILVNEEFEHLGKQTAAGILFLQNIVLWKEGGYFDIDATLKPLLHLWSLAVEEQFYIIFPPLFLLFWKKKWNMVILLWTLLLVSFIGNVIMSYQGKDTSFYITTYRGWEFLGGSLLAWWHFGQGHKEKIFGGNWISLAGLMMLIAGMMMLHQEDPYPGWRALLPVTGTLLIIGAGKHSWANRFLLSHPLLVWIGLISYPLYLFHWPPLSFLHIVKGNHLPVSYVLAALGIGFVLTLLVYYLIEKPLRFSKSKKVVPRLVVAFFAMGILGTLVWSGIIPPSLAAHDSRMKNIQRAIQDHAWCENFTKVRLKNCININKVGGNGPQTLFFGDSHVVQYAPRIREILKNNKGSTRGAIVLAYGGVPPLPGVTNPEKEHCGELVPFLKEVIQQYPKIDRVVIAAYWLTYCAGAPSRFCYHGLPLSAEAGRKASLEAFGDLIKELTAKGKKVTVVLNIPVGEEFNPRFSYNRHFFAPSEEKQRILTKEAFLKKSAPLMDEIAAVAKANGACIIDPVDYLTKDGICLSEDEDGPIHHDDCHLRAGFVAKKVKYLDETVSP